MSNFNSSIKSPTTLRDVAAAAGVSVSTASKIFLGQTSNFKASTVKKVKSVATELNYVPNALARGMVTGANSHVVGFFIPNILNTFFAEFVNCLEKQLVKEGYLLTLCLFDDKPELMSRYLKFLIEIRAAGAIFGSCSIPNCINDIISAREYLKMVSVQCDFENMDRIDVDDADGTYEAVSHLIKKGHRKIGFVGYRYDMTIMNQRLSGYKRALHESGIPIRPEYIKEGQHSMISGKKQTTELLNLSDPPTAIHCANEFIAQAVCKSIFECGLKIPDDISVTAFDNTSIASTINPPLTTVEQPIEAMAQTSVDLLLDQINGKPQSATPRHVFFSHRFLERNSVADINPK